jgi:hypothetical protein
MPLVAAKDRTVEEQLARLGTEAHGVVTRRELLGAGLTSHEIQQRLRIGSLIRVHRGVYRVGHRAPSVDARYLAAVRACGADALLCGRAAGHLLRLTKGRAPTPEVVAPGEHDVPGLLTHRRRRTDRHDATTFNGVPVTTVPRTLVDLAAVLPESNLARACHEAEVLHRTTPAMVEVVLARTTTAAGAATLRAILLGEVPVSLSKIERVFFDLLRGVRLPLPETNRTVDGRRLDCRWPKQRVTAEIDGYRYHHSRHAWDQDRWRDRAARIRGDEPRRYTYADVMEDPRYMLAELSALLRNRPGF